MRCLWTLMRIVIKLLINNMVIYEADGYGKEGRNIVLEESIEMKSWIYM